jgi:chromosome partitioning protein
LAVEAAVQREADLLPEDGVLLLDCPPSLGLLTVNALTAAGELFVPIQAEFYALDGVSQLVKTMELVRSALNPKLQISLVALTMISTSTHAQDSVQDDASAFFGERLATTVIPRDPAANAAPAAGLTVLTFAPDSEVATAYRALAKELLQAPIQRSLDLSDTTSTTATEELPDQQSLVATSGGTG